MVREAQVAGLIQRWSDSSNDSDIISQAMQKSAEQEFGFSGTSQWSNGGGNINDPTSLGDRVLSRAVQAEVDANGVLYRGFLRAQYEVTQQQLAKLEDYRTLFHRGGAA